MIVKAHPDHVRDFPEKQKWVQTALVTYLLDAKHQLLHQNWSYRAVADKHRTPENKTDAANSVDMVGVFVGVLGLLVALHILYREMGLLNFVLYLLFIICSCFMGLKVARDFHKAR